MKCEDCKYWFYKTTQIRTDKSNIPFKDQSRDKMENKIGYCKRFPKSFRLHYIQSMVYGEKSEPSVRDEFPVMNEYDWCGEFKTK